MDMWLTSTLLVLGSTVFAVWNQIQFFFQRLISLAIVQIELKELAADAIQLYLQEKFTFSLYGPRTYAGKYLFVKKINRYTGVCYETLGKFGQLFWSGWKPIWLMRVRDGDGIPGGSSRAPTTVVLYYLRGMFDADQLLIEATDYANKSAQSDHDYRRHVINFITGSAGRMFATPVRDVFDDNIENYWRRANRWLTFSSKDIYGERGTGEILQNLAFDPPVQKQIEAVITWYNSRDWYTEHGVPWQFGLVLQGPPGTGKTALARGLAQTLDLPVFSYDLASLTNDELRSAWKEMMGSTPCMALLEDIDGVFNGRQPVGSVKLTFDLLLNCLDGIDTQYGLLSVITTNNPDMLDPALVRPGRAGTCVVLQALSEESRWKLVNRINVDCSDEEKARLVEQGSGMTGAQFQDICTRLALERHYQK